MATTKEERATLRKVARTCGMDPTAKSLLDQVDALEAEVARLRAAAIAAVPTGNDLRHIIGAPGRLPDAEVDRITEAIRRDIARALAGGAK